MENSIFLDYFENKDDISNIIIDSLYDNLTFESINNRLESQEERDFCFPFILHSLSLSCSIKSLKILSTWLIFIDPKNSTLNQSDLNFFLQKVFNQVSRIFINATSQKDQIVKSAVDIYHSLIFSNSVDYHNLILSETWYIILSSIITSISYSIDSDCGGILIKLFIKGLSLGRITENYATILIETLPKIFIENKVQNYYWLILFSNIMDIFFNFPNLNSSNFEILAHKYSIKLIFTIKRFIINSNLQDIIYQSLFDAIMNVLDSKRMIKEHILKDPFPIKPLFLLFSDIIFLNKIQTLQVHIKLLTFGNFQYNSKLIEDGNNIAAPKCNVCRKNK